MLKLFDVCAGIGGFSLGLETTGQFKTVGFCEIDPYCQKVLNKHWPDVPIYTDLKEISRDEEAINNLPEFDIISAGIPCQSFSGLGNNEGKKDDRYLWPYLFKIIKQKKPTYILIENVTNFINVALDELCNDLENKMYSTQSFSIPACSIQAPHKRDRLFCVAYSNSTSIQRRENIKKIKRNWKKRNQFISRCSKLFRRSYWSGQSRICRILNGIPNRVDRIKGLGNSVVPQVVHNIGLAIAEDFKYEN